MRTYGPLSYLRDRLAVSLIALACLIIVASMALVLGITSAGATAIGIALGLGLGLMGVADYLRRAAYYRELQALTKDIPDAWQIPRLINEPLSREAQLSYEAIESIGTAAARAVEDHQQRWLDYCSYIELWIHEIKTPIATMRLILDKLHGLEGDKLRGELFRIDQAVEQALYYARSTSLSNDYLIREQHLASLVTDVCKHYAQLLIESKIAPQIELDPDITVLADRSWLSFVLGQVISNTAKYGAHRLRFRSWETKRAGQQNTTVLEIADDGIGITAADVPRVFERAFVGSNGRLNGRATGMGLYLSACVCDRMGLGISLASEEGVGTRVLISFPHNRSYLTLNQKRGKVTEM